MTNEVKTQEKELMATEFEVNGQQVKLNANTVKNFLVSGNGNITDQEALMFISLCKYQHLNPFLQEAYLVKFGNSPAQQIVSKEAFMKRAEQNKHFKGMKAGCIVLRNNELTYTKGAFILPKDELVGGWAEVNRDDRDTPTHIEIGYKEFSKGQATWKAMPANMIRKTAIVNALREAFPIDLGAMYTEDDKQDIGQTPKPETKANVQPKQSIDELIGNDEKPAKEPKKAVKDVTPEQAKNDQAKTESKSMTAEEISKLQDNFLKQSMAEGEDDDAEDGKESTEDNEQTSIFD